MVHASILNLLAEHNLASPVQFAAWNKAWRLAVEGGSQEGLLSFIAREHGTTDDLFLRELARTLSWPFIEIGKMDISTEARKKISTKVAFEYEVLPTKFEDGILQVAVSNPFDSAMLGAVQFDAHCPVHFALSTRKDLEKALKKYYGVGAETLDEMTEADEPSDSLVKDKEITNEDHEASVISFLNQIIWEAFKERATDIHFEPEEDELRIRYRIDGILNQVPMPPQLQRYQAAVISRIKVMSGMNIAEKRLPQDGRINVRIHGEEIDIRVSTVPTVYGESVSLRLLPRAEIFLSMEKLGIEPAEEARLREIIVKPYGIFLVTGPTGSGKSTSLYAFLSTINSVTKRIITIEEPVEYELKGVNQIAVRSDIGLTFAAGLRSILRQDPNVIMVGEIRDAETAEIAIRASLTGHLVFSTLHTNDAPSAFTRLIDMGIEPFLLASAMEAVLAQRLVRTICPNCKAATPVAHSYLMHIEFPENEIDTTTFFKGAGCEACRMQGYQGRIGIYELLLMDENLRPLVMGRATASAVALVAMSNGMHTLRYDGWKKVKGGKTTIEEVLRVTEADENLASLSANLTNRPEPVSTNKVATAAVNITGKSHENGASAGLPALSRAAIQPV